MPDGVLAKGCAGATVVDYWGALKFSFRMRTLAFVAMHRFEDPVGDLLGRDLTGGAVELATRGYDFPAHLVEANS